VTDTLRRLALRAAATLAVVPRAGAARADDAPAPASGDPGTEDLAYGDDPRQRLDVHRPDGAPPPGGRPVVVFFYGGSWNRGSRSTYRFVGRALASRGIVTAIPDYRTYPQVRYPDFLRDGAAAIAWLRPRLARFGGDPSRIVVAGHSAGAYNAAMLAMDPRWLGEAGLSPSVLAGFAGLAGPYDFLPIVNPDVRPVFHHPDYPPDTQPIDHARGVRMPVFLGAAASDSLVDPDRNTGGLARRLREAGTTVVERRYPRANHVTLVGAFAWPLRWIAPVLDDVAGFVDGLPAGAPPAARAAS